MENSDYSVLSELKYKSYTNLILNYEVTANII